MSDTDQPQAPGIPSSGIAIGSGGGFESSLSAAASPTEMPADEPPLLPRGGLVALRKSGGLRFTSRRVVVYRSGRVLTSDSAGAARQSRLSADELDSLKHLILRAQLARHKPAGTQPPDGYAYELAARVSKRLRSVEVYDGAMPEAIRELIEALSALY